ncbi:MAG: hypothetical protein HYY93_16605 [Planctomycetes bacterium]|nr:hypothetical protein [Planctomycetota bacterium]
MADWREQDLGGNPPMPPWLVRQIRFWRYGSLGIGLASWVIWLAPLAWFKATSPNARFFTAYGLVAGTLTHRFDPILLSIGCTAAIVGSIGGMISAVLGLKALGAKSPPALFIGFAVCFALLLLNLFLPGGQRGPVR